MIAALALAATTLAAISPTDVGIVFRSSAGTAQLVAACPRIAVVDASSGGAELVRTFLASCPTSQVVFQLPVFPQTPPVSSEVDARVQATTYWTVFAPSALTGLTLATSAERAATWLAAPPGFDAFPSWRTDASCAAGAVFCAADYVAAFLAELDRRARADGFRGVILEPFSPQSNDRPGALCTLLAALDRFTASDVAWTYDAVSPGLAQSAAAEDTTTFGYRALRTSCASARAHPLLVRVSVAGGWQSRASATGFIDWLRFLDREVDADAEPFLGLALYGYGTNDANDVAPIATQLAAFLVNPSAPPGGGGTGGGSGPPSTPPTEPGSNLGPDRGSTVGCSTAGGGTLALLALVPLTLVAGRGRRRATSTSASR